MEKASYELGFATKEHSVEMQTKNNYSALIWLLIALSIVLLI